MKRYINSSKGSLLTPINYPLQINRIRCKPYIFELIKFYNWHECDQEDRNHTGPRAFSFISQRKMYRLDENLNQVFNETVLWISLFRLVNILI